MATMHKHHAPTPLPSSTMCPSELVSMGRHPRLLLRLPSHSLGSLPRSTRCRSPPTPWPPWKLRPLQPPLAHTCGQAAVGHLGLSKQPRGCSRAPGCSTASPCPGVPHPWPKNNKLSRLLCSNRVGASSSNSRKGEGLNANS
jgi:hypothetical protein